MRHVGRVQLGPHAHRLARAMMIIGDWKKPQSIAREIGTPRECASHLLNKLRQEGFVERRVSGHRAGYEWRLTPAGVAFALNAEPDDTNGQRPAVRYNHRPLAAALGMTHAFEPPPGRLHLLR